MSSQITPEILSELQKYKRHKQGACLKCGYVGYLGVGKTSKLVYWCKDVILILIVLGYFWVFLDWSFLTAFVIYLILETVITYFIGNANLVCPLCHDSKYNPAPTQPIKQHNTFNENDGTLVEKDKTY